MMETQTLDPIAQLEQMARRQKAETDAASAIAKARVALVLGRDAPAAFFATLALRMKPQPDWGIETASTDGKSLRYNPDFVASLSPQQRVGLLAHEVMHPAHGHHWRRDGRDHKRFNIAADLAINPIIREANMTLPPGALFPGQGQYAKLPDGLAAEEYYSRLPQDPDGPGQPGDDPGKCGTVEDAGDPAQQQASQAEWRVAVAQAATAAKQRGKMPGGLARLVDEIVNPKVPWQDELREFVSRTLAARDDYTWGCPNRRFIAQGIYLPSLRSEALGEIVVAIDTSGSTVPYLESFAGELNGILECQPCSVSIVYCDAQVNKVVNWEPSDGPLVLEPVGGGGTSHRPVWEWLKESGAAPECVVCLTDGYTSWGDDPGVPVLWAITPDGSDDAPFGRVIHLD